MKQQLSDAIEAYGRFRRSQDYSKSTLKVDDGILRRFLSINGNIWVHTITERHVERHFDEVSRTRQSASLQNDHGVLNRFFKWARHTGRMPVDCDPMFGRRQPKANRRERNRIPVSDFPRLLDIAEERDPRDRALVALLLYTMGRDSDISDLRLRDLDLTNDWLTMRIKKTRQEDLMPVSEELAEEMRRWLTHYSATTERPLERGDFLVPARGVYPMRDPETGRISRHRSVYRPDKQIGPAGRIVNPILERMGFPVVDQNNKPCGEGAHTIRRSGARALFDELARDGGYDHPLRIVQSMLHHASVTQTETYIGVTADRRTRDELLRGKRMYARNEGASIIQIAR